MKKKFTKFFVTILNKDVDKLEKKKTKAQIDRFKRKYQIILAFDTNRFE